MSRTEQRPPMPVRIPKTIALHDTTLQDDFSWLCDKASAETLDYLHAENAYTAAMMADTASLQAQLYTEMLSHIQEDDTSVPYRDGGWMYWTKTEKGKQYPVYLRAPVAPDSGAVAGDMQGEILIDVNELAVGQPFLQVGSLALSPNAKLFAYTTDNVGFRQYTLHLLDLASKILLPQVTAERVGSISWAADSQTLFFTTEDEQTKRQDRLFRIAIDSGQPVEVFHEPEERFNLGVGKTGDRKYLLLESASHTTSETWFLDAAQPGGEFRSIAPRVDDEEYSVDHRDGYFYLHTNHEAPQFRVMRTRVETPGREDWVEILAEVPDSPLEDVDLFQKFLVASYREEGLPVLRVYLLAEDGLPASPTDIRFPDPAFEAFTEINRDFQTTSLRYGYESLVRPASVFSYDIFTKASTLLREQAVPGGFDASRYLSKRVWFTAADGTRVPVSLMYRDDLFKKGAAPLHLYGYGSYGYALPLGFRATRLPLLDRGMVLAYAHIRGGGELGDPWHDAGKMMCKRSTFTDFIEAAEFLVCEQYADPAKVAIEGGSAGGLLMGAVVNMRPELFRAVVSHVPFVDVMNTMLDATLPLTVAEYEEWGNPNEPAAFHYMLSYSPYENLDKLDPAQVPAMLVKTSLNDSQVMYWEPAKYVAKLRTLKQNDTPLLLHINMEAGHGGASGRYDYLKELAFDDAFLLRELGMTGI